jgi:hypothetical protein
VKTVTMVRFDLDDDLHKRTKTVAAWRDETLRAFIAQAIETAVTEAEQQMLKQLGKGQG